VRDCSWQLCSLACCRVRRVARSQWVMSVFQAAVHEASPATEVATAAAILPLGRDRRRPSVDLAVCCFYCLTYIRGPQVPTFVQRPGTLYTTLTPQPHYEQPHHTTFQNVVRCRITQVWCGCGVGVVCLVPGRRLALVGHHMFISVHYGPKTPPYYFLNKLVKNGTRGRIAAATCCICRDKPDKP